MASFNKVILVGNLTRDPELRYTPKGMAIAKIGMAVNRVWKSEAGETKEEVTFVDVDAFGRGIGRYWDLKKKLDPGSTNEAIERLLRPVERYLTGKVLPGAGGGGFVLMLARDAEAALQVRRLLRRNPPNQMARFFDFDIDHKGLSVTVL